MHEDITAFSHDDIKRPFELTMCGVSYCDGTYRITRPNSPVWCLEYIIKGEGYVQVDNTSFIAAAGDIYILPTGRNHYYYSDDKNPWEKIWFNISGELAEKLMETYRLNNTFHITGFSAYPLFREFIDTAKGAFDAEEASKLCAGCFLKIVQEIYEYVNFNRNKKVQSVALRFKTKLDNISDFSVSFDSLISDMYCTKSHIIREFRSVYGITPYRYLLEKKLNVARMMIDNTGMSIKEISAYLGFQDCHYFSNFFKKYTGISPQKYRQQKTK